MTRNPRGFEAVEDAEIASGLRLKSFIVRRPLADARISTPALIDDLVAFAAGAAAIELGLGRD